MCYWLLWVAEFLDGIYVKPLTHEGHPIKDPWTA